MTGTVKYTDGFVNTIQHINVLSNSLQQIWSNQPDATVGVQMTGQLRMIEVGLGWDIHVDVDGHHFYTGVVEIPIIYFDFSVSKYYRHHCHLSAFIPYYVGSALHVSLDSESCSKGWLPLVLQSAACQTSTLLGNIR